MNVDSFFRQSERESSQEKQVDLISGRKYYYLLTNWLAYLYRRIQSPRPDVMPDRREGITRPAGFVFACIDTQAS